MLLNNPSCCVLLCTRKCAHVAVQFSLTLLHNAQNGRVTLKKRFKYFKLEKKNTEKENESRRVRKKSVLPPFWSTHSLCCATPSLLLMQIRTFQVEDVDDALALSASFFLLSSTLSLSLFFSLSLIYNLAITDVSAMLYSRRVCSNVVEGNPSHRSLSLSSLYFLVQQHYVGSCSCSCCPRIYNITYRRPEAYPDYTISHGTLKNLSSHMTCKLYTWLVGSLVFAAVHFLLPTNRLDLIQQLHSI